MFSLDIPVLEIVVSLLLVGLVGWQGVSKFFGKTSTTTPPANAAAFLPGLFPGMMFLGQHTGEIAALGLQLLESWAESIHPADAKGQFYLALLKQLLGAIKANPTPMIPGVPTPAAPAPGASPVTPPASP